MPHVRDYHHPASRSIGFPDYAPCSAAHDLAQMGNKQHLEEVWAMARNRVQFQKGLSAPEFERLYGTEEQCRAVIVASRWPDGFVCPACGGTRHSVVKTRGLYQCSACRTQTSAFRRDDLRRDQAEAARLGPNPLSPDPDQAGDLQNRPRPASRRGDADHRLEDQAQARSGHVRTRR